MNISKYYRSFLRRALNAENKKRLTNKNFTLLCNNCVGGVILHELGERFNSPTVNLFFDAEDYVKFLGKLDYYLAQTLVEVESDKDYPVARLDDVTIFLCIIQLLMRQKRYGKREQQELTVVIYTLFWFSRIIVLRRF